MKKCPTCGGLVKTILVAVTPDGRPAALTEREEEVLRTYAAADTTRSAAAKLGLSEQTIKNHLLSIRAKLGAASSRQAALIFYGVPTNEGDPQ